MSAIVRTEGLVKRYDRTLATSKTGSFQAARRLVDVDLATHEGAQDLE